MPLGRSPYARDAQPVRRLPEAEETEDRGFVRGTGPRARALWRGATCAAVLVMAVLVGLAGYQSETAGVATAYAAALIIGFLAGGWAGVARAQRSGPRLGRPMPYVSAIGGAFFLFLLALVFFEGIFPAL